MQLALGDQTHKDESKFGVAIVRTYPLNTRPFQCIRRADSLTGTLSSPFATCCVVPYEQLRMIEVRTRAEAQPTRQDAMNIGQAEGKAGLQYHALELCREGEKEAPTTGKQGDESIGTLSCATMVYTERNWKTEVRVKEHS